MMFIGAEQAFVAADYTVVSDMHLIGLWKPVHFVASFKDLQIESVDSYFSELYRIFYISVETFCVLLKSE